VRDLRKIFFWVRSQVMIDKRPPAPPPAPAAAAAAVPVAPKAPKDIFQQDVRSLKAAAAEQKVALQQQKEQQLETAQATASKSGTG